MPHRDPEARAAYEQTPERRAAKRAHDHNYYVAHREQKQAYDRAYRDAKREKRHAQHLARYAANREQRIAYSRDYYAAHREQVNAKRRENLLIVGGDTISLLTMPQGVRELGLLIKQARRVIRDNKREIA